MDGPGAGSIALSALVVGLALILFAGWPIWLVLLTVPFAALLAGAPEK